ncbi:hypothetical protein GYMLUDRAFT_250010 [Collybiopsis luxurians FD-317 M1]|uniref:Uncharacterized protein n=1 Tax=Collybiopsis luxurians FD-317 M1 TaxID=944289 RepID=A0A0D0BGI7_9AGAR|nr:hypothetical protein GYMLUDRAFT_250010 [Collybiopsis luxurians FD-317 M1]
MSVLQSFPDQPAASSSNLGGSRPRLILKVPQSFQLASLVPFFNALPSAPPMAKKMRRMAFECSTHLRYPSISIMDSVPNSLPTGLQPIYEDAYLANLSPEVLDRIDVKEWRSIFRNYLSCEYCESHNLHSSCSLHPDSLLCSTCEANYPSSKKFCSFKSIFRLLQFHILTKLPLIVAYRIVSSRGLFIIRGEEWTALTTGLRTVPYYRSHPEELGLPLDGPRVSEGKQKAGESNESASQLLWEEGLHLGELSHEQVVPTLSRKGKEVIRDTADDDMEMGAPEELDTMTLDYPEDVSPPPVPVLTPPAPVWKAIDNWRDPSEGSFLTRDEMIRAAIDRVIKRISSLLSGSRKMMLEQDLWALADGLLQGAFDNLEEELQHSPSKPPVPFSSESLLRFVKSLTVVNMTSANIVNSQQDELLRVYREYQALTCSAEHSKAENLCLQEQVASRDAQLKDWDDKLNCLKSFVQHFMGNVQLTEVQQLREALEGQESEIKSLEAKLAASEEARRVATEELQLRDTELSQL